MNNICTNIGDNWCIITNLPKVFPNSHLSFNYLSKCKYTGASMLWSKFISIHTGVHLYLKRIDWKHNIQLMNQFKLLKIFANLTPN